MQFSTFIEAFAGASKLAAEQLLKDVKGDYTPDPNAQRFPKLEPRMVGPELDLWAMWEKYSPRLKPATRKRWRSVMRAVEKRFGRDLAHLSFESLVSWRDELVAQGLHPTTISEVYLAAVRWILNRCVKDRKPLANVGFGIEVEKSTTPRLRDREFTMEEVRLILHAVGSTSRIRLAPFVRVANAGVLHALDQGLTLGVDLPKPARTKSGSFSASAGRRAATKSTRLCTTTAGGMSPNVLKMATAFGGSMVRQP